MHDWLEIILRRDVIRRSSRVALLVGTVLVLINHGDALITARLTTIDIVKIIMTYCIPYCISTYASVLAVMEERKSSE